MKWIFIGLLWNSTVTFQHDTREACEGRAKVLSEKGVYGKCIEIVVIGVTSSGYITLSPGGYITN